MTLHSSPYQKITLGEVADVISGFAFKSTDFDDKGIPVIKIKNIRLGYVDLSEASYVDKKHLSIPDRFHVKSGDVLISLTGSHITQPNSVVGRIARHANGQPRCLLNQRAGKIIVKDIRVCDPRFLFYALSEQETMLAIAVKAHGAASQANVSPSQVESIEISFPSLPVQQRISGILSAYDDLIENNQRRIKILEAMSRGLYREWFVHFRFPGHENHPRVASAIGEIPQGWEVLHLGDIVDISWGDTSKTKSSYVQDGFPAYSASGMDGKLDHYDYDRVGIVLSAIGAQCGKSWLARGKWSCIKNTIRFWANSSKASTEFLFVASYGQNFWPRRGAAQPFISQGDAQRIELLIPDLITMNRFTEFVAKLFCQISTLEHQVQNLANTRDLLLPRLLSGQIKV